MVIKEMNTVENLLNTLSPFLTSQGGLKTEDECTKFFKCVEPLGHSLLHTCTYLNIVNATENEELLSKLLTLGFWDTLYSWLEELKSLSDSSALTLILSTFHKLPVTMPLLKANKTAKLIKSLVKHSDEGVSSLASQIVDKWMALVKSAAVRTVENNPSSDSLGKDKRKKKEKQIKTLTESNGSIDSTDVMEQDVPSPPPAPLFKESGTSSSSSQTAKIRQVKERSAGVEAGVIKPKARGSKQSQTSTSSNAKPTIPEASAASTNDLSSHKRLNGTLKDGDSKRPKLEHEKEEDKPKAIPRPKPNHIVEESDGFMSALMTPKSTQLIKKKKITQTNGLTKVPLSPTTKEPGPTSPTSPLTAAPPSFYRDTLEGPSGASPPRPTAETAEDADRLSPVERQQSAELVDSTSQDSSNQETPQKAGKKMVRWREEKDLREFFYFELFEDERVNVNRKNDKGEGFNDMSKREKMTEREMLKGIQSTVNHSNAPPTLTENFHWKMPAHIDNLIPPKVEPGSRSAEKAIQIQRESVVLAALYFGKASAPDSASEPDRDEDVVSNPLHTPSTIPLEAELVMISEAPAPISTVSGSLSVTDLIPGMSEADMAFIHQLASAEKVPELLEAIARTDPSSLNQLINSKGLNMPPLSYEEEQMEQDDFMANGFPINNANRGFQGSSRGQGFPQFDGMRAQTPQRFSSRGGFRGSSRGNRGRGGFVNAAGRGRPEECYHFTKHGKCDYGNNCKFAHNVPAR